MSLALLSICHSGQAQQLGTTKRVYLLYPPLPRDTKIADSQYNISWVGRLAYKCAIYQLLRGTPLEAINWSPGIFILDSRSREHHHHQKLRCHYLASSSHLNTITSHFWCGRKSSSSIHFDTLSDANIYSPFIHLFDCIFDDDDLLWRGRE